MTKWIFILSLSLKACFCLSIPPMVLVGNYSNSSEINNKSMDLAFDMQNAMDLGSGPNNHNRIVGGYLATQGTETTAPWQVILVGTSTTHISMCGGTLLSSWVVVTAAHCIADGFTYSVQLGGLDKSSLPLKRDVKTIYVHKDYDSTKTLDNDIALLILEKEVDYSFFWYIQPASLPPADENVDYAMNIARVSGWGKTSWNGPSSTKLKAADVKIQSSITCKQAYSKPIDGYQYVYTDNMICASYAQDACQGDSGGPLVVRKSTSYTLIGIVSWGYKCAVKPGVYTKVTNYVTWIKEKAEEGGAPLNNTAKNHTCSGLILAMLSSYLVTLLRY